MDDSPPLKEDESTPKILTQQQVEDFILLAGQREERWFKLCFIDEDMNKDPTAIALMESLADVIHAGVISMAFEERMEQAQEDTKGVYNGRH